MTSWFCRKHTGRPPRNLLPQAGTAFRLHLQTTHSRPTRPRRDAGARPVKEAEARPESSQDQTPSGPSVARADGVMVLMSPRIAAKRPVARTCRRPGLGSPLRLAGRSGHCSCSLLACLVAGQDCAQQRAGSCLSTEGAGPLHQTCPTPGHLDPGR